jgi:2-iminobutanoate/2-iminopropanoate deaminase
MDRVTSVTTDKAPQAIGPYSQAIQCAGWLFTSGQVALDPGTGELLRGSFEQEVVRVLDNLAAVLTAGGSGLDRVVKTTVFLTDLNDFGAMNSVYARYFGASRPARSTVQVAALPRGARVEIEAVAWRG